MMSDDVEPQNPTADGTPSDKATPESSGDGVRSRQVAITALARIDETQSYANLLLPSVLERSGLDDRDRRFVTELVYGTTRMQRSCDWLVDRFLLRDQLDAPIRAALRLGAYQLAFLGTKPHAAVNATVEATVGPGAKTVNAVLRRVADDLGNSRSGGEAADTPAIAWPDDGTRLSYPDWIMALLVRDLGESDALAALETMNRPAPVHRRDDGYVQDLSSQWVADAVGATPTDVVVDLCAGPGGKTTAMAACGAHVIASDQRRRRARLVANNAERVASPRVSVLAADGASMPLRPGCADRVLVDAPCTGLGALRRRPDARWRIEPDGLERLVVIQRELVDSAVQLVKPGGVLVYSVCTLTDREIVGVDEHLATRHPDFTPLDHLGGPWDPIGRADRLLPQREDTDGMAMLRLRRQGSADA